MKREYDAIIQNVAGTNFTGFYKKGINLKLTDNTTVITIWKPGQCPYYQNEVYEDAIIELSGNGTNRFTYQDMRKLSTAIEYAIDYLNQEPENKIDREKISSYNRIPREEKTKVKLVALKQSEIKVGGIYEDNKGTQWIYLGNGTLLENDHIVNRFNNDQKAVTYIYMKYQENALTQIGDNMFKINSCESPDTYSAKKDFLPRLQNS